MNRLAYFIAWLLATGALQAQAEPAGTAEAAPATDAIVCRARIPSAERAHGETRLIRRDDGACVQTLLYTTALRRGVHEMLKKERTSWPEGVPGFGDSQAYAAALEGAKQHVLANAPTNAPADAPYALLMEVTLTPDAATYAFFDVAVRPVDGEFVLSDKRLITSTAAPRHYVSRAMRLMSAAAFHLPDADLANRLAAAGWTDVPEVAP